nr:galactokinase [uncultured Sediminibacterium sp.]
MNLAASQLTSLFQEAFNSTETPLIVRSPGRVNIIGEHTDYNEGFVLPAAIDKAAYIAITLRYDDEIHLLAHDLNERFTIKLNELKPIGDVSWPNYILGAAAQFQNITGTQLKGFNALLTSDVPIGAGLSSSAAVECATVFALNTLLSSGIDRVSMVKMAQKAEHEYAGVLCGIMDQFASMMGKKDHVIKLDCRSLDYTYVPFQLQDIKVVLLNTNVKHSLASSEYNTRRQECNQAVSIIQQYIPSVRSLRDVTETMLNQYVQDDHPLVYQRSLFIVQEIQRLQDACIDLQKGDLFALGKKMYATHHGLSAMYDVSCKELDWLIQFVEARKEVIGARMMGGGFGGCTINLIKENEIEKLLTEIKPAYETAMELPLTYYISSIENGTEIVQHR